MGSLTTDFFKDGLGNKTVDTAEVSIRINGRGSSASTIHNPYCSTSIRYSPKPPSYTNKNTMYIDLNNAYINKVRNIDVILVGTPYQDGYYYLNIENASSVPDGFMFNLYINISNSSYYNLIIDSNINFVTLTHTYNKIMSLDYTNSLNIMKIGNKLNIINANHWVTEG